MNQVFTDFQNWTTLNMTCTQFYCKSESSVNDANENERNEKETDSMNTNSLCQKYAYNTSQTEQLLKQNGLVD